MRILMWLTIGFGVACGLCGYGIAEPGLPLWLLALILPGLLLGRKFKRAGKAAVVLLGCLLGFFWFGHYYESFLAAPAALDESTQPLSIHITDYSYDTAYGTGVDGRIELEGKTYQVRAYLNDKITLVPGDVVTGEFRLRITTAEGADTYHAGKGIFLLAYENGEEAKVESAKRTWREFPAVLREKLRSILERTFPADTAPFAKALLLGDTRDFDYETDTSFKVSGIRHVVAVSGLHVSILFAVLTAVTFHKRFLTAAVGFPALLLFAAVAGFSPSVNRACMMAGLMLLALLVEKEYDGPAALAFAAMVMLLYNPLVITAVGFQLSVSSVAGIFLFQNSIYNWLIDRLEPTKKPKERSLASRWLGVSVSISLSAMALTTPLCAYYFHTVSLIGVLTNLLTLWLITAIFYGLMGVCLLSLLWQTGAVILAWIFSWPIRYSLFTAKILARFPLAAVYTASPYVVAWLVFVYALLAVFLLQKEKNPGLLGCCAVLGLCFALLASYVEPMLDDTRFTVLDVGQGQCLLLQSGGRTYLVDCGGDSDSGTADLAAERLLSQGVFKLDGLILTHLDRDHAGAAENLLTRIPADLLIQPPAPGGRAGGKTRLFASKDLGLDWDGGRITVFSSQYPGNGNENSLCVLFETEKCVILITGDRDSYGERSLLRHTALPKVDVLMAGHHGSKYSTCDELLAAVSPDIVCISAGRDNPYGHPAPEVLERIQNDGCEVYRTDQNGTILIRR